MSLLDNIKKINYISVNCRWCNHDLEKCRCPENMFSLQDVTPCVVIYYVDNNGEKQEISVARDFDNNKWDAKE